MPKRQGEEDANEFDDSLHLKVLFPPARQQGG